MARESSGYKYKDTEYIWVRVFVNYALSLNNTNITIKLLHGSMTSGDYLAVLS